MAEARLVEPATRAFKAAHATGPDWGRVAKACLEDLGAPPPGANLGFLYATDPLAADMASLLTFLRERTGIEHWVGTVGLGISTGGAETYDEPAATLLVCALPDDSFRLMPSLRAAGDAADVLDGGWSAAQVPLFGIVHGDPRNTDLPDILSGLSQSLPAFLVGGLSASRGDTPQIADRLTEGGLSGVLFSAELPVSVGLTQGCSPIGPVRQITAAEHNVVMEIDGRPALEVFKEDIGELLAHDLRRVSGYIYVAFPITGSDTGDYLVRNLTGIDLENACISVGELIEPGRSLMFCRRDHDAAKQDLKRMLADLNQRTAGQAKAGLYFSCLARGQNLFGSDSEELKMIRQELGDIPLAGFFANGEISNDRLYGYTGVLALFL